MSQFSDLPSWPKVTFSELPNEEVSSRLLDLHSFINLINVISSVASLAGGRNPSPALRLLIDSADRATSEFVQSDGASMEALLIRPEFRNSLAELIHAWASADDEHSREWSLLLNDILVIFDRRLHEYREIRDQPMLRKTFTPDEIRDQLVQFFRVMSVYSGGRFEVVNDGEDRPSGTHLLRFEIDPGSAAVFELPLVAIDSLHDFAANARKYSPRGGEIVIRCHRQEEGIVLGVRDEGVGIPEEELSRVANFGYRARNAGAITTMGAGFGLTKALSVAERCGGTLTIASSLGAGTAVELFLPFPSGS